MADEVVDQEMESIPEGAGIAEILRWAMSHDVPLQYPPWEDHFCGSPNPCVYAGMVQGEGVREENRKLMARRHAEWLVDNMSMVTPAEDGNPSVKEFPTLGFYIAVADATDHSSPSIHMFSYDLAETIRKNYPCVDWFDGELVDRRGKNRTSPLHGIRTLALEGFVVELSNLIRDHLLQEDEKREAAMAEIEETNPEVLNGQPDSEQLQEPDA